MTDIIEWWNLTALASRLLAMKQYAATKLKALEIDQVAAHGI